VVGKRGGASEEQEQGDGAGETKTGTEKKGGAEMCGIGAAVMGYDEVGSAGQRKWIVRESEQARNSLCRQPSNGHD
jgi:hypothetical protein